MRGPCLNCDKRTVQPNCHSNCEAYQAFNKEREEVRDSKNKAYQSSYFPPAKMKRKRKKEI